MYTEFDAVVRDSIDHIIPEENLNSRTKDTKVVVGLLSVNPTVILTADGNLNGKSTFARILRRNILVNPGSYPFSDCVFMKTSDISASPRYSGRQNRLTAYDNLSIGDLIRFSGLLIFDEVYPEYYPLMDVFKKARRLLIIQPNFLEGPPFDDEVHQEFVEWIRGNNIPIYLLKPYDRSTLKFT